MSLWIYDSQHRALDRGSGNLYYWTNVFYWLQDDAASLPSSAVVDALSTATWYAARPNNTRVSYRVRNLAGSYDVVTSAPEVGAYGTPSSADWFIPWCFYARGYDAGGSPIAYKRVRGCWATVDVVSNQMSDGLYAYLQYYTDHYLTPLPLCNVRGVPIVRWEMERTLRSWQRRHGSKRAARPVFV